MSTMTNSSYVPTMQTHEGHPLTTKEAVFIDNYLVSNNATQAYIEAYGNKKTARQLASRLLSKVYIKSEINYRLEQAKTESIADATEILQYFTDVMRGKIKDQFGLEASLGERTKAAQELAKRQIDIQSKLAGNEQPELKITLDWARPTKTEENEAVEISDADGDDGK